MSEEIAVATITLAGVVVTAVLSYLAARSSRKAVNHVSAIDDAVNHRHPGEPRLLDIIKGIRANQEMFRDRIDIVDLKIDTMGAAFDLRLDAVTHEFREADSHFLNRDEVDQAIRDDKGV